MMAGTSFNHFPEISVALRVALSQLVTKTALAGQKNIQNAIVANGQVDTGFMLNSVHVEDGENDLSKNILIGADYWAYQNYGTRFLPARPFVEPAMEQTMVGFEEAVAAIEGLLAV